MESVIEHVLCYMKVTIYNVIFLLCKKGKVCYINT